MTEEEFKVMMEANQWHPREDLQKTLDALLPLCTPDKEKPWKSISGWRWSANPDWRAKYVDIRIDMRDGGFILMDRNGKRISLDQIQAQDRDDA